MLEIKIIKKINRDYLEKKFRHNVLNKCIESEQWFKNYKLWYELTAFSNPYITIYSEFVLLIKNLNRISKYLSKRALVFYGLGTGDTEILLVNALLSKEKTINIIGVEVQKQFINGFIQSLKNIDLEDKNYKINFLGINGLFQDIKKKEITTLGKRQAHIILGNTIGNFKEDEIYEVFNKLMNNGDILISGFQTNIEIKTIFKQYSQNIMFNNFIKKIVPSCKDLIWKINKKESQIEAWSGDILLFHSKKKSPANMIKDAKRFGFLKLYSVNDKKSGIQILEKI